MNILIIGSNNPMAIELSIYLSNLSHNVFFISSSKKNSKNTFMLDLSKTLNEKNMLKKILPLKKKVFGCVIVFSTKGVSYNNSIELLSTNLKIYKNLISVIKNIKTNKIINVSSIYVNNIVKKNYIKNNEYYYSLSKYLCENILIKEFKDKIILNLRLPQVTSPRYKNKGVLNSLLTDLKKTNKINVYNKKRIIDFIDMDFFIKSILKLLDSKKSTTKVIKGKSISLNNYAISLKKKYGDINTEIIYKN